VCPFQGDQYFWGAAVHRAGAGPEPLPAKKPAPRGLAAAIHAAIHSAGMRSSAADLSARIAEEDGTGQAAGEIEGVLAAS